MATIPAKPAVGDPVKKSWGDAVVDALSDHETRIGVVESQALPNGSFETDDGSGGAEGWGLVITGTATATYTAASVRHGKRALEISVPAAGDQAQATSEMYVRCAPGERIEVGAFIAATAAGVSVKIELLWYYWTGSAWAAASTPSSTIYESTANPTSWAERCGQAVAPSGTSPAQAYRVRLTVAEAGGVTGTVHIDGVRARRYHGLVPVSRTLLSNSAGTISIAGQAGDEHPTAALIQYEWAGDGVTPQDTTFVLAGDGKTALSLTTVNTVEGQAQVALNPDLEFSVTTSGGTPDKVNTYLVGFLV